jgi:fucose permease
MFSRLLAARLLKGMGKARIILGNALIALVGCLLLLSARSLVLLAFGTALIGLSYGPIFPTTLAIAGDRYRERAGAVFGLLFSIALLGGMSFPWAVGQFSEKFSVHVGMMVPAAGAIAITASSAIMMFRDRGAAQISKANKTSF